MLSAVCYDSHCTLEISKMLGLELNNEASFEELNRALDSKFPNPCHTHFLIFQMIWDRELLKAWRQSYSGTNISKIINSNEHQFLLHKEYATEYLSGELKLEYTDWAKRFLKETEKFAYLRKFSNHVASF